MLTIPPLKFDSKALEPLLSEQVVNLHYEKHTRKYFDAANKLIKGTIFQDKDITDIVKNHTFQHSNALLFNNVAQAYNHAFYWDTLSPKQPVKIGNNLQNAIDDKYGSLEDLKNLFFKTADEFFGSGWIWLTWKNNDLHIKTAPNAGTPFAEHKTTPLLCCDLWEHAWYPQYDIRKSEYLKAFWELIDWTTVNARFDAREGA